ncbi:MAG TPA: isoprenylcysteine carboxylmethyltransferase family protein [Vicinamibacterales bacterium]|nr:isoprenylcysteine carboxylmethyltransferase family protein [Vicinamibacterales bacterium]
MPDPSARLARWRVPSGFLFGALVLWLARPTVLSIAIGAGVAAVGEAIRFWAAGHLRKGQEVTMSGPYRWTRHPLYVGSSVIGIGLAIGASSVVAALLIGLYLGVMLTAAIRSEEAFLTRKFGTRYDEYRRAGAETGAARRPFSVRQAMANREYRAVIGLVVALALLAGRGLLK